MHTSDVARNPSDYQQYSAHVSNAAEGIARLPPPPNPKSTEASIHTVKVYPPLRQPFPIDYPNRNIYQNNIPNIRNYHSYGDRYGGKVSFQQQQQQRPISPQLMSNDYNVDLAYTTNANVRIPLFFFSFKKKLFFTFQLIRYIRMFIFI